MGLAGFGKEEKEKHGFNHIFPLILASLQRASSFDPVSWPCTADEGKRLTLHTRLQLYPNKYVQFSTSLPTLFFKRMDIKGKKYTGVLETG